MANEDVAREIAEGIKALANLILAAKFKSTGEKCPNCQHEPVYIRTLGTPPFWQHDQKSCPCRLLRQAGQNVACGCEWTQDI